jgi:transcriptional regulator with XRE-family HTH domain
MIVHTHTMTAGTEPPRRNPLGPTGETVRANLQRLREAKNLGYANLARMLEEIRRPIPELGLRRIESGDRRVDADDLVALAAVLGVSPITLLLPGMPGADKSEGAVAAPGEDVTAGRLWLWLRADAPLPGYKGSQRRFFVDARPEWDAGPGDPRWWTKETPDGDD